MAEYKYGLSSIQMGGINASTGLPESLAAIGEVFENTVILETDDPKVTRFMSELKTDPIIINKEKGSKRLKFTLMDTAADTVVLFCGGTVTAGSDSPDVWNEPLDTPVIEKSFQLTTKDGGMLTINRGDVFAKPMGNFSDDGMVNLEVTVDILAPNVTGVSAITFTDYTVVAS